jgi:hypothetical protein
MRLHLPWGSGLGTLGLTTSTAYRDIRRDKSGAWYLFVSDQQDYRGLPQRQSWYKLRCSAWQLRWVLLRRVDKFGEWKQLQGKPRRKPMMWVVENAAEAAVRQARLLGQELKPYKTIDWYGAIMECISYPFPEKASVRIMLRQPGDPTTMVEQVLLEMVEVAQ